MYLFIIVYELQNVEKNRKEIVCRMTVVIPNENLSSTSYLKNTRRGNTKLFHYENNTVF